MENRVDNSKRSQFLTILAVATVEEINSMIEQKGKEAKPIPLVVFYEQ